MKSSKREKTASSPLTSPSKRTRVTSSSTKVDPDGHNGLISDSSRVIIALDLDAFYVSACRKRDPSLVGIPIGIQQKALVATISYEAREAGVNKLDSIKDALKKCPDMVLVNGEDLTYFRQVSAQVWRLVRNIVWHKRVEKLGMDELFCDVTEMIDRHISMCHSSAESDGKTGEVWFDLWPPDEDGATGRRGFYYQPWPSLPPGHVHPETAAHYLESHSPDRFQQRMLAAAHLAYYLRQKIADEVGLTCSAGIAHSKTLAKLVGTLNKPNQQTAFAPNVESGAFPGSPTYARKHDVLTAEVNAFLDPLDLRKLTGFGRVVVDKIREHLYPGAGRKTDEGEDTRPKITVGTARKALSFEIMQSLFGDVIGPKLWALLCGRDSEAVVPAPDFPLQLSIEDTYPYPSLRGQAIHEQIGVLSRSLLKRLELELIEENLQSGTLRSVYHEPISLSQTIEPTDEKASGSSSKITEVVVRDYTEVSGSDMGETNTTEAKKTWLRYPLKLRLSVRQGWNNRISKQTQMPVEIFDLQRSLDARAMIIAKACRGLLRALIGGDDVVGDGMNLINIAALELSETRPTRALDSFFSTAAGKSPRKTTVTHPDEMNLSNSAGPMMQIDRSFLLQIPPDLRAEIAAEYNISLEADDQVVEQTEEPVSLSFAVIPESSDNMVCSVCGGAMDIWLQHDHDAWPELGMPASTDFGDLSQEEQDDTNQK